MFLFNRLFSHRGTRHGGDTDPEAEARKFLSRFVEEMDDYWFNNNHWRPGRGNDKDGTHVDAFINLARLLNWLAEQLGIGRENWETDFDLGVLNQLLLTGTVTVSDLDVLVRRMTGPGTLRDTIKRFLISSPRTVPPPALELLLLAITIMPTEGVVESYGSIVDRGNLLRYCGNSRNQDLVHQKELTVRFGAPDFFVSDEFCRKVGLRLATVGDGRGKVGFREARPGTLEHQMADAAIRKRTGREETPLDFSSKRKCT